MLGVAGQLLLAHRKPARADRVTFLERNARTPPNHKARILRTNFSELFSGHGAHDSHQISDLERVASGEHEVHNASNRAVPAANTGAVYAVKACKSETQHFGDGTVCTRARCARIRHRTVQVLKAKVSRDNRLRDDLSFLHSHVAHQVVNCLDNSVTSSGAGDAVAACHSSTQCHNPEQRLVSARSKIGQRRQADHSCRTTLNGN